MAASPSGPSERGAAIVELAMVAGLLVFLALGVLEVGAAWSDHQALTQSSRSGARVASQMGTAGEADAEVLRAIDASLGPLGGQIRRVVVYEADINGDMPAACSAAVPGYSGSGHCNVYGRSDLDSLDDVTQWGSGSSCGPTDSNWCSATERVDIQSTATFIGVKVELDRPLLTGVFGAGTHTLSETTVMRIEPDLQ